MDDFGLAVTAVLDGVKPEEFFKDNEVYQALSSSEQDLQYERALNFAKHEIGTDSYDELVQGKDADDLSDVKEVVDVLLNNGMEQALGSNSAELSAAEQEVRDSLKDLPPGLRDQVCASQPDPIVQNVCATFKP